jgi:hypothetical protein
MNFYINDRLMQKFASNCSTINGGFGAIAAIMLVDE